MIPERTLKRCCCGSARPREGSLRSVRLCLAGMLKFDELITKVRPIDQTTEAYEDPGRGILTRGLIVFD